MKKLTMSLAAAALTAAAFAAISVAQDDGGNGEAGKGEVERAPHPGPPRMHELSAEDREAMESFRSCMEENGAPPPPEPPQGDAFERRLEPPSEEERAKIDEAFEACRDELPEGARAFGPGPGGPPCGPPPGVRPAPEGEGS